MNLRRWIAVLWVCGLAGWTSAAFAQGFALPSKNPNTESTCTGCPEADSGGKVVGYGPALSTFTGRFLDSSYQVDYQFTLRTLRAYRAKVDPVRKRFYVIEGSLMSSYDFDSFTTRLAAGEPLAPSTRWPGNQRRTRAEEFLWPDRYFYAEASAWVTPIVDGMERLSDFDFDDRGYLYLAYSVFGWGMVKDEGTNSMPNLFQIPPAQLQLEPKRILAVKVGGASPRYYAFVAALGGQGNIMQVWDVTNAESPVALPTQARSFDTYAKNADGSVVALVDPQHRVNLFTADGLVANQPPIATFVSSTGTVTSDGVNFYTTASSSGDLMIGVISPDGHGGYALNKVNTHSKFGAQILDFSSITPSAPQLSGYISAWGYDSSQQDVQLFKVDSTGGITQIFVNAYAPASGNTNSLPYWKSYYGFNPLATGYIKAHETAYYTAHVHRQNGKAYWLLSNAGLGDVYEIKTGDSVGVTVSGPAGQVNSNAPLASRTTSFYGDPISFTGTTTAASPLFLQWNFGNAEALAGSDANITSTTPSGQPAVTGSPITHRYSNLSPANCYPMTANCSVSRPRTVSATSSGGTDPIVGSNTVQLQAPTLRVGVTGSDKYLVALPDVTSPTPIVVGDQFLDSSDGTAESHFNSWSITSADYNSSGNSAPYPDTIPVGTCGAVRTLSFDAHYGFYNAGSWSTLGADWTLPLHGFRYAVRPFAAGISVNASGNSIVFSSRSKATGDAAFLSTLSADQRAALNTLQYTWELLNANGTPVLDTAGLPLRTNGVGPFSVAKSYFTSLGIRAHLTIKSAVPFSCGTDMTTSDVYTDPLNGPSFTVTGDCTSGGPPCSFSVLPATGADTSDWTYLWSYSPTTGVNATSLNGSTFTPTFTSVGTYTISVTVANLIGNKTASKSVTVTTPGTTCPPIIPTGANANMFISYIAPSGCTQVNGSCTAGELVSFSIGTFYGYQISCAPHTFAWRFGDGTTGSGQTPLAHSYSSSGIKHVEVDVNNGGQSLTTLRQDVVVGGVVQPPPPPPPPPTPGSCGTMVANSNVYVIYSAPSGCSPYNAAVPCKDNETITFVATSSQYNFACAPHTFTWNFGSGGSGAGQTANKQLPAGNYAPTLTIQNSGSGQTVTIPFALSVISGGGTTPPPTPAPTGSCTLTQSSFYVGYVGATSLCTAIAGDCKPNETISFGAYPNGTNSCPGAAFSWDYGDTTASFVGQQGQHKYSTGGKYNVVLSITGSGNQSVQLQQKVSVSDGSPVQPSTTIDFTVAPWPGVPNGYQFVATSKPAGAITQWHFDFGDGNSSTNATAHNVYADATNHTVTLTSSQLSGVQVTHDLNYVAPPPPPPARRRASSH